MKRRKGWLEFDLLSSFPSIRHGVFTRPLDVMKNRAPIQEGLELEAIVGCNQTHGVDIHVVAPPFHDIADSCDGLMTNQKNVGLLIRHADCQAALFYDPVKQVIGNIHAGWRGNVRNIYKAATEKFHAVYGSNPSDLRVCISPSLGPRYAEFVNYQTEFPPSFASYQVVPNYFDLWAIARAQLIECGVLPEHIEVASLCTYAHSEDFFSYRRDKTTSRNGTVISLN